MIRGVSVATYKFRFYPTDIQERLLLGWLELCRLLYNWALTERREHYKHTGCSLAYVDQQDALPTYKQEHPECLPVHSQVLQNVLARLDRAFVNFFEEHARYPRFKRYGEYRSITYPQIKPEDIGEHSIVLSKIGRVRMVKHRPVKGMPKTLTIIRELSGEWYAAITVELKPYLPAGNMRLPQRPVGIDSGLTNYLYLSDGTHVDNPCFLNKHEKQIRKVQRRLSRKKRIKKNITLRTGEAKTVSAWSNNGLRAKVLLAKRWQKYTDVKNDWQWKRANQLVTTYDFIAYEGLPIRNMLKNHNLARAIQDASWAGFWQKVENKAAQADSTIRTQKVNPKYTTQRCSRCGCRHQIALSERTYRCPNCGYVAPRDHNSSEIILTDGLDASGLRVAQPIGMDVPESTPVEIGPLPPETERSMMVASLVEEAGNKFLARGRTSQTLRDNVHGNPRASMGEHHNGTNDELLDINYMAFTLLRSVHGDEDDGSLGSLQHTFTCSKIQV
jgi:putative transposase